MKLCKLLGMSALAIMLIVVVGCERKITTEGDGDTQFTDCFTCHGDEGVLLAARGEWQNSIHASGTSVDYTNRGGRDCTQCHNHQGFLEYVETGAVSAPYNNVSAIHCFTCHAPHERGDLSLRVDDAYTLKNGEVFDHNEANLCANCHHANYNVEVIADNQPISNRFGPHHGPQADLLIGTGGYEFDGEDYGSTLHASEENLANGCIGCHMGNPEAHDGYMIGGHSFNMVDEESGENLAGVCEGCHDMDEVEGFDYDGRQSQVDSLLDTLGTLLYEYGIVDDEFVALTDTVADGDAAGALYNFVLVEEDRSHGIHNPQYITDLLETSIAYMESALITKKMVAERYRPLAAH